MSSLPFGPFGPGKGRPSGPFGPFGPPRTLASAWRPDSQDIESINSLIKAETRRSPHCSLALLDARIGIRRYLGMGIAVFNAKKKWSDCKDAVNAALDEGVSHCHLADGVYGMVRFSTPPADMTLTIPTPSFIEGGDLDAAAMEWGASYNLAVKRLVKSRLPVILDIEGIGTYICGQDRRLGAQQEEEGGGG
eukprot:9498038-Pyramimonas_sp.AAC.1